MELSAAVLLAPAPLGALTVGVTAAGLALVAFGAQPGRARCAAERLDLRLLVDEPGSGRSAAAVAQLAEYLAGERREFDLPLDWRLTHPGAQRRVLQALHATVPYGAVVTYGELAARGGLDSPRGVGTIMGSNPIPVVVPCHRVLAADGLGGFGGGLATKEWLLALEGVLPAALDLGL